MDILKELRKATVEDYELIYNLRFSKEAIQNSLTKDKPTLQKHKIWFEEHYKEYLIYKDFAFLRTEPNGFISIVVDMFHQNQGFATKILKELREGKAIILLNNNASIKCFIKSGFKIKGFYLEKEGEMR